ncbi:hypothetical protein A0H81_04238 [Grifola frondosa]|uniref:Uncharacterized protein n=1 Tax=Grifola frondosa TaxID=5627 RepID=A0A1C7MKP8_GRIFR|nr:hypothetical protein A0H81_04238 [Grifola frondosa]
MLELLRTYGKSIHTWAIDISPDLPLGPPNLMMSYTGEGQGPPEQMIKKRDETCGMNTDAKKELRKGYLPSYNVVDGSDEWEKTEKGITFEARECDLKP